MAAPCRARAATADVEITYSVNLRGDVYADVERFARTVTATLHDPRGWSLGGRIDFRRVPSGGDMRIVLASPEAVEAASPACDAAWSCQVRRQVLINELRWDTGTDSWEERPQRAYRHYVVNHEVGHFLGLEHRHCRQPGGPAPVMQQQSISLEGCHTNVWPHLAELRKVARTQNVPVPQVSPSAADAGSVSKQARAAQRGETPGINGRLPSAGGKEATPGYLTSRETGATPAARLSRNARPSEPELVESCRREGLLRQLAGLF